MLQPFNFIDLPNKAQYNILMDFKVYKKEEVYQPQGNAEVLVPDIIDIIPIEAEVTSTGDIRNGVWTLEQLKRVADVSVVDNKLVINSDNVRYENGNLIVTVTENQIVSCEILDDEDKDLIEQESALATIFQRGLDPLDLQDGIQWSEVLLGEVNILQLMEQIVEAVSKVSLHVRVDFSTIKTENGQSVLTYSIKEVA